MQCSADLYERICTLPFPFPPSFFLPSSRMHVCMYAWLGFSGGGGGGGAAVIVDVVVFVVFMEREEFKKNKGRGEG